MTLTQLSPSVAPSLAQPWVLIRWGKAAPALAHIIRERETFSGKSFACDVMVAEMNQTRGIPQWRKRLDYALNVADHDILHVFPFAPTPYHVAEARRAFRREQRAQAR
jgi:hypothetical protein